MDLALRQTVEEIRDILIAAKSHYGGDETRRLEEAFVRTVRRQPLRSPHRLQRPDLFIPELRTIPWIEPEELAAAAILADHFEEIRAEVMALVDSEGAFHVYDDGVEDGQTDWNALGLKVGGGVVERGQRLCPKTLEVIEQLPRVGEVAMVSALAAGGHIEPHCGPTNLRVNLHFGVNIPPGDCGLRVGGEARKWTEGECLVFDDSFEHEAWNFSDRTRHVLLINFWHPDLSDAEVEVLNRVNRVVAPRYSRFFEHN
ncbi:MAG: aspartyl/asparaginyl beta-hydroxylase domain-containing protein [Acidobacteriota bacterium]